MIDLRDRTVASLAHARYMAGNLRGQLADMEARLGAVAFRESERAIEGRLLLASIEADVERQAAELVALDAIVTARAQMGRAMQAAYREIVGVDPPGDYVFPVPIPN